jgi:hypothetical protein
MIAHSLHWKGTHVRRFARTVCWSALATSLLACATPYQAYRSFSLTGRVGGYQDFPINGADRGRYFVSFNSNPYTRETQVLEGWHRRASELCPKGYEVVAIRCRCTEFILFRKRAEGSIRCGPPAKPDSITESDAKPTAVEPKKKLRTTGDIYKGDD